MKMKKAIARIIIVMMVAILGIGMMLPSLAVKNGDRSLALSYFRIVNGESTNGYKIPIYGNNNTTGQHPIFEIYPTDGNNPNNTSYYCLNALFGYSWSNAMNPEATTRDPASYTQYYDLNDSEEIANLANNTQQEYRSIAGEYKDQILWILENLYIPGASNKNSFLSMAGIEYADVNNAKKAYKYIPSEGYNYINKLNDWEIATGGWNYYDSSDNYVSLDITDDVIGISQQLALWYYTNYKLNNSSNNQTFNFKDFKVQLYKGLNGDDPYTDWTSIGVHDKITVGDQTIDLGKWVEDQVTIITSYLIDAADNYATSGAQATGNPLTISPDIANIAEKTVNNTNYYVVGPIKIDENRPATLNNEIFVNGDNNTGAYISNAEGNRASDQQTANYIGQDFYVAIPKSKVSGSNVSEITITFTGSYNTTTKIMWVNNSVGEQPIVEVAPQPVTFELSVRARIPEQPKVFDLALRKRITAINGKKTNGAIINEAGYSAVRAMENVDTSSIPNTYTATYKHRKDPVVVKKGDIVTYSITVYNEGEMDGYAKTIVDKLPQGLALSGFTANRTTRGTCKAGEINYSYEYNPNNNTIIFTRLDSDNDKTINAYNGQGNLDSETIQIDCEVVQEPSTTTNTYLTNIAYISKAHNTETNLDVEQDRDSSTNNKPQANQNTTGDTYTGYHGSSNKNVYNDTNNDRDYFPGMEDDDDFEIVVVKPAEFDLALKKYIEEIIPDDLAFDDTIFDDDRGRNAPIINTSKLKPNGNETTANYTFEPDKKPIKVKSGDYVLYNFTVYNEGEVDGYVKKITDNIPEGLEFVYAKEPKDGKTVIKYDSQGNMEEIEVSSGVYELIGMNSSWSIDATNNKPITDSYNGKETTSISCDVPNWGADDIGFGKPGFLKAYDSSKDNNYDGAGLDRLSVKVLLRVNADFKTVEQPIRNEAAITKATLDEEGNIIQDRDFIDRDSQTNQWPGKDGDKNYQDDEDYDHIVLERVDLALTKFIIAFSEKYPFKDGDYLTDNGTNINAGSSSNPYTRQTAVNTNPLKDGENDAIYTQVKTSLSVPAESYVLYNIRVYNEGDVDVYAGEVKDYLPNYLDFVEGEANDRYGWKVASDGKTVTTDYLSKAKNADKILKAFDKDNDNGNGSLLDYQDLPILCRVNTNAPDKTRLVNSSEITKYEDKDGKEIETDIDSQPDNLPEDKKNKEGKPEGRYDQDDEDYEVIEIKKPIVDLALTKFLTAVSKDDKIENGEYLTPNGNIGSKENPYDRATKVETAPLKEGKDDAKYTMVKDSYPVPAESYVLYNIRVYNEGPTNVYAGEVKDYLPNYLEFVEGEFNTAYGWKVSSDGKTVTTNYLSKENGTDKILKAFDKDNDDDFGSGLDYKDLPILCKVNTKAPDKAKLVNSSEITKYEDKNGNEINTDRDSQPDNLPEDKKNKEGKPEGRYDQDDEDYEVIEIKKPIVDLALTKFIAAVSNDTDISDGEYLTPNGSVGSKENPYDRATEVITKDLKEDPNCHDADYHMIKDGLVVPAQSYVLYNIRVYNEGQADVYAGEVTDHLPEYLDYVDCEFNKNFGWSVASDGKTISTTYLSHDVNPDKILKAFDRDNDDKHGSGLDYQDLQVLCRVNDKAPTNTNIVNVAEITRYENKDGDPIPDDDIDSKPNNVNEKNEDDDDYEVVLIKTFDLSLLKYVSEVYVTEDGKTTTTQTGNTGDNSKDIIPKVEINKKKLNSTVVKFGYTIKITNEGDIEGYAKEITDYVPEGLKFYAEDNNGWKDEGNNVISTRLLENTLLKPGESAEVKVIFRWINGSNNLGLKTNVAEISEDYNKEGIPDRDSTPDNRKEGEDDIDDAKVILSIKTGLVFNIVMYATIGLVILIVLGTGITAIKKYVL